MADLQGFDASTVEPRGDFEPLPAGTYLAMIGKSEMRPTKDGQGEYLYLELSVAEGEFEGRMLFDRLNLVNRNEKAVDIARRTLSSICRAVGVITPRDSSDLHDRPLLVKVTVKPERDGYQASNEVRGYAARDGGTKTAPDSSPAKVPPWKKGK